MDWSNEDYVRMYTRETSDDLMLSWEAIALWRAMMCKFDRSGLIPTRRGARGLSALTRIPLMVVESALAELIADGRVQAKEVGYFAPNFIAAQTAIKSDKQRQREARERRAAETSALPNVNGHDSAVDLVTPCDETESTRHAGSRTSRNVTLTSAYLTVADPLLRVAIGDHASASPPLKPTSEPRDGSIQSEKKPRASRRKGVLAPMPDSWEPRPQEIEKAQAMGLDASMQSERFRNHHGARGSVFANWDQAFRSWLDKAQEFSAGRNGHRGPTRSIAEIAMDRAREAEAREARGKGSA